MKIVTFDTSISSSNLGDFIIMEAVNRQISSIFPEAMQFFAYTHDKISKPTYSLLDEADYKIVGGTNLLSSNMNKYNQWKINLIDSFKVNDILLMGVGWWQYQNNPNLYTRYLLKSILHKSKIHSVRDSYTENKLKSVGINNVINTACPTMWGLTKDHCREIPSKKGEAVVFTLTDYSKDPKQDISLIQTLLEKYKDVKFWPQGGGDLSYYKSLKFEGNIDVLPPTLRSFNSALKNIDSLDYVGTRLHAGIKALQERKRTIIISIDNRAEKKADDFNIQICSRDNIDHLGDMISSEFDTTIDLPSQNIEKWKNQFS